MSDEDDGIAENSDDDSPQTAAAAPLGGVSAAGGLSALDMPGAAEAMQALVKSSAQARAALQRARSQIAARKYSSAIPLLAVSAALGAPTRAGSSAEGWANAAGALTGPLREKQAFEQQQQKEMLGIDTSLSGLDQNTAMTQLQLAELRAKMRADLMKLPVQKVLTQDVKGKPVLDANGNPMAQYERQDLSIGKPAWTPVPAKTSVNLNTEKGLYGGMAEDLHKDYTTQYKTATDAPNAIERNNQLRDLLDKNPYTGAGAGWKLAFGKAAKAVGINYAGDDIKNTELLYSNLGQETLDNIHSSGLGAGQGFTDNDRKFLERVVGGKIELDKDTLRRLVDLHESAARRSITKWNSTFSRLDPAQLKLLGVTPVEMPALRKIKAPALAPPPSLIAPPPPQQQQDEDESDAPASGDIPDANEAAATNPGTISFYSFGKRKP